ncbi:hypothetical protein [Aeromicrobium sp. Root495]|uniref:hypothetical protein n=1 Tax=Aeromicrobium sp. Root495 TaxID=1736550 RepID=UPI000AC6C277|nr:hypothetical protein [Aeromicrobium sp. Root495]
MIRTETCVLLTCDDCSEAAPFLEDMGTAHWPSLEAAVEDLVTGVDEELRWTITEGLQVCDRCTLKRRCKIDGHDWEGWWAYPRDPAQWMRVCRTCGESEQSASEPPVAEQEVPR